MFGLPRKVYWFAACLIAAIAIWLPFSFWRGTAQQPALTATVLRRPGNGQVETQAQRPPSAKELDDASTPIVDMTLTNTSQIAETKERKEKNKRFNNQSLVTEQPASGGGDVNVTSEAIIPDMPFALSDLVIVGEVADSRAFLSEDRTGVYSEFTISTIEVIKPTLSASVRPGDSITTERFGGRVRYPSGPIVRYKVSGQGSPMKGAKYVFFLKQKEDKSYLVLTAYELRENKVFALDGSRTNVNARGNSPFDKHNGKDTQDFRNELEQAKLRGGNNEK
jgi:hypothetical protein